MNNQNLKIDENSNHPNIITSQVDNDYDDDDDTNEVATHKEESEGYSLPSNFISIEPGVLASRNNIASVVVTANVYEDFEISLPQTLHDTYSLLLSSNAKLNFSINLLEPITVNDRKISSFMLPNSPIVPLGMATVTPILGSEQFENLKKNNPDFAEQIRKRINKLLKMSHAIASMRQNQAPGEIKQVTNEELNDFDNRTKKLISWIESDKFNDGIKPVEKKSKKKKLKDKATKEQQYSISELVEKLAETDPENSKAFLEMVNEIVKSIGMQLSF